jgi:hypothetical protein
MCVCATVLVLLTVLLRPLSAHSGAVAIAVPIEKIVVDGDLSDWPEDGFRYLLRREYDSELIPAAAHLRASYDSTARTLFLAVEVEITDQSFSTEILLRPQHEGSARQHHLRDDDLIRLTLAADSLTAIHRGVHVRSTVTQSLLVPGVRIGASEVEQAGASVSEFSVQFDDPSVRHGDVLGLAVFLHARGEYPGYAWGDARVKGDLILSPPNGHFEEATIGRIGSHAYTDGLVNSWRQGSVQGLLGGAVVLLVVIHLMLFLYKRESDNLYFVVAILGAYAFLFVVQNRVYDPFGEYEWLVHQIVGFSAPQIALVSGCRLLYTSLGFRVPRYYHLLIPFLGVTTGLIFDKSIGLKLDTFAGPASA